MKYALIKTFGVTALAAAVAACGGGDSSSDSTASTGSMSVGLTDAPVDGVSEVNIVVTGLVLQPADGERVSFTLEEPANLNLLDLQGGAVEALVTSEDVPAGDYSWMRLQLGEQSEFSVLTDEGGVENLRVPSGDQRGLQTSGFVVPAGGEVSFTIDFDVRKSLVYPPGQDQYLLKPVLRLVDNSEVGTLVGEVDYATLNQDETLGCNYEGAVYVYTGTVTEENLTDLNVTLTGDEAETQPLVVVPVNQDGGDSLYSYIAAFLPAGEYTVSYSCQIDDNEASDDLTFVGTQQVTIEAGETTTAATIPSD